MLKLALVQMSVEGGRLDRNLEHASQRVREACENGSNIVLLPECMDLGWTHPSALTCAEPIPGGKTFEHLRSLAQECGVYLCAGMVERAGEQTYNSAVLLSPKGELLLLHRKLNELDIGHPYYAQGDRLGVCETEYGTIGLMICADAFAKDQVITRSLGYMGADLILSPSSWAVPPDHDNEQTPYGGSWDSTYSGVCKEFSLWIASTSNVGLLTAGPWKDWNCIGCSRVVSPTGETTFAGPYGASADTILYQEVEITPRPARGCGWHQHWSQRDK